MHPNLSFEARFRWRVWLT